MGIGNKNIKEGGDWVNGEVVAPSVFSMRSDNNKMEIHQ